MNDFLEAILAVIVELAIRLPGASIVKVFRPNQELDSDSFLVVIVGFLFWCGLFGILWLVFA